MIGKKSKKKKALKLFVMNAKVLKKRKKPVNLSPFTWEKVVRLGAMVMVLGTCGFGGYKVSHYLLSNSRFTVKRIAVSGNEKLSKEQVIGFSSLKEGENIFRAGIHGAKEQLSKVAMIECASVTRVVPDTIVIQVVERVPRARLWGSTRFLVDYSGVVLPRRSSSDPERLPLIKGVDTEDLSVGDRCSQPALIKAMEVLQLCESPRLSDIVEVEEIDCSSGDDIRLYLREGSYTRRGCEVCLGADDSEQKLANLAELLVPAVENYRKTLRKVIYLRSDYAYIGF